MHAKRGIPTPDITLLIDISEKTAEERAKNIGVLDKFEGNKDFRNKVYSHYLSLAELAKSPEYKEFFGPVEIIDGNGKPEEVAKSVFDAITPIYNPWHFSNHGVYPRIRNKKKKEKS